MLGKNGGDVMYGRAGVVNKKDELISMKRLLARYI